jgi:uncharacterized integral membrane protein
MDDVTQPPGSAPEGSDKGKRTSNPRWGAIAVTVVIGVSLIDFIVQNTRSVRIEFFSASGQMPVAVALLASALAGAFVVAAIVASRTARQRRVARRARRGGHDSTADPSGMTYATDQSGARDREHGRRGRGR